MALGFELEQRRQEEEKSFDWRAEGLFISQVKYIDPNFPFDNLWEYKLAKNIGELFSSRSTRTQSSYRFLKDIDYR